MNATYIVPVVGHPHLRPDQKNLAIKDDDSAVIIVVLVFERPWIHVKLISIEIQRSNLHSDITNNTLCLFTLQDFRKDFPRVEHGITYSLAQQ